MDSATTSWSDEQGWELYNDDGFVYKRKKRRLNPDETAISAEASADPEAEERSRRERRRKTLVNLKERYQREIDQWELLSNTLREMDDKARQRQQEPREEDGQDQTSSFSGLPFPLPEFVNGSLVNELLLQVNWVFFACGFVWFVGKCVKRKEIEFGSLGFYEKIEIPLKLSLN